MVDYLKMVHPVTTVVSRHAHVLLISCPKFSMQGFCYKRVVSNQ